MKVAVVGATGLVGSVMLKVLEERNFPITELIPVASEKSVGKKINFKNKDYTIVGLADAVNLKLEIALFSAGGSTSLEWAPKFAKMGTTVIDNSSAWRMDGAAIVRSAADKRGRVMRIVSFSLQGGNIRRTGEFPR